MGDDQDVRIAGVTIGVDMAKPGTEETVVLVRVCGCGKNPACPEGPACPFGFHIARRRKA